MKEQDKPHNQDLRTLIERYALSDDVYQPLSIDVMNGNPRNMKNAGPRSGMIYGELTKHGLVHVWADPDKSQYSNAEVLIIGKNSVTTYAHTYNRATGAHDWQDNAGLTFSVPLAPDSGHPQLEPINDILANRFPEAREHAIKAYQRVSRALGAFANLKSRYDALHQTELLRNPEVHENCAQLYPYAGHLIGPRINVGEMIRAGVPFHPAVAEAMAITSEMMTTE